MPTCAQDRLKRLQSTLKKIDKSEKAPKFSSNGCQSQHKQIEAANSLLSVLDDSNPNGCAVQRKTHLTKLINSEQAAIRLKSTTRSEHNAEVPNISLPTDVGLKFSCIKTTEHTPPTSRKSKIQTNCSEFQISEEEKIDGNNSDIISGTVSICAMRKVTQPKNAKPSTRSRFVTAYKKLRIAWEKPKALIDAVNQINSKIPGTKFFNKANERLTRLHTTLRKSQTTEIVAYNCEPMDWQPINDHDRDLTIQVTKTDYDEENTNDDLCEVRSGFSESAASDYLGNFNVCRANIKKANINQEPKSREVAQSSEKHLKRTFMSDIVSQLYCDNKSNVTVPNYKLDYLYFVLDTNVLLNYLVFVDELTQISLCDTAGGMLYIPYVVIRELDNLKDRNGKESIRLKAIQAIRYLNTKFDESLNIQAQSALMEKKHLIDIECPDDSIVNSCLQLKSIVQHMMLLTDDGNLRLKAKASGIPVSTKSDLIAQHPEKFIELQKSKPN